MPNQKGRKELEQALRQVMEGAAVEAQPPASTYRLQLSSTFGFEEARAILPYLRSLGISALYLSPILKARAGSTHGYDVVDFGRINPELGGESGFEALAAAAAEAGMGVIVDIVPNHMGIGPENAWWWDLLENGPSSVHADTFDVDWRPLKAELTGKVLLPILGDQYGAVLERGELRLDREGGAFVLRYFETRLPIAPWSVPHILRHSLDDLVKVLAPEDGHLQELQSICTSLDKLGPRDSREPSLLAERAREKEVAKRRLAALCEASPEVLGSLERSLALFRGQPGLPRSFDRLHALLEEQAYRLAYWRVAGQEINYRRFFDVNDLAAVRMESPRVFQAAHGLLFALVGSGRVQGLRVDHPDGLYDPTGYFARIQASVLAARACAIVRAAGEPIDEAAVEELTTSVARDIQAGSIRARPLYLVVEKILARGERMPEAWAVHGSTGYDFLNDVNGLFVDPAGAKPLEALRRRLGASHADFGAEAVANKYVIVGTLMASEIQVLVHRLNRNSETNRRTRDFTVAELRRALVEFIAHFPTYRTYVTPMGEVQARDVAFIETALGRAQRAAPNLDPSIFDFLRDVLLLRFPEELSAAEQGGWLEFVLKLQQVTGPITAKAVEDTTFYGHVRLASLNEVGGDPDRFGVVPETFHSRNAERLARWPGSLLATSTHDTKRAEDARTRIDALSEIPEEWAGRIRTWLRLNRRFTRRLEGGAAPDRTDQLLFYQTLVGTWPDAARPGSEGWDGYCARIRSYMEKAVREAKRHSSWFRVNTPYEEALAGFVDAALSSSAFVSDLEPLARRIAEAGRLSSLAQLALKGISPGVADVYQGTELWDDSLVDPDNRRPVDFAARATILAALDARPEGAVGVRAALARELAGALSDGRAKLLLLSTLLRQRREHPALFLQGAYVPILATGDDVDHVVALARVHQARAILCIAPRLTLRKLDRGRPLMWRAQLPLPPELRRDWVDVLTDARHHGDALDVGTCLADFPVAVLASDLR